MRTQAERICLNNELFTTGSEAKKMPPGTSLPPSEYTSLFASTRPAPAHCSGDVYIGVPSMRTQCLECDAPVARLLTRFVDRSHASGDEESNDAVGSDLSAFGKSRPYNLCGRAAVGRHVVWDTESARTRSTAQSVDPRLSK